MRDLYDVCAWPAVPPRLQALCQQQQLAELLARWLLSRLPAWGQAAAGRVGRLPLLLEQAAHSWLALPERALSSWLTNVRYTQALVLAAQTCGIERPALHKDCSKLYISRAQAVVRL